MPDRRMLAAAAAATVLLGAAACGSGGQSPEPPPVPTGEVPDRVAPSNLPEPPKIEKEAGARSDAEMGECRTNAGEQTVTGKVTNNTDKTTDYVITISWVNSTFDVYGRGIAVVKGLKAGTSKDWKISAKLDRDAAQCSLNVKRGEVKS